MKQWRVGTLSMGISLIILGIMLFSSQWRGQDVLNTLLTWWPLIFILLGLELLMYLGVSRLSNPIVKYDMFSIFFVGCICMVCIGFIVLTSSGLMQAIRYEVSSVDRTEAIPSIEERLQSQVKKVVVQNNGSEIVVNRSQSQVSEQAVHVFGSYRYTALEGEDQLKDSDSVVSVRTIGDTMYVQIDPPSRRNGVHASYTQMNVTIVIPEGLTTKITGKYRII